MYRFFVITAPRVFILIHAVQTRDLDTTQHDEKHHKKALKLTNTANITSQCDNICVIILQLLEN